MNKKINALPQHIKLMLDKFITSGKKEFYRLIVIDNKFYDLLFIINPEIENLSNNMYENSFDKYIAMEIDLFIKKTFKNERREADLIILFNYNETQAYKIKIIMKSKNPNHIYKYNPTEKPIIDKSEIIIQKIYKIIASAGQSGISKSDLYFKTRSIETNVRDNFINTLIQSNRISFITSGKYKPKTMYFVR